MLEQLCLSCMPCKSLWSKSLDSMCTLGKGIAKACVEGLLTRICSWRDHIRSKCLRPVEGLSRAFRADRWCGPPSWALRVCSLSSGKVGGSVASLLAWPLPPQSALSQKRSTRALWQGFDTHHGRTSRLPGSDRAWRTLSIRQQLSGCLDRALLEVGSVIQDVLWWAIFTRAPEEQLVHCRRDPAAKGGY